ncbi:MAG TPA: D-alanine--D-alanine ligase [bacterium]|nr:D-alanine--D-alanine ligase [bacterium]
MSSASDRSPADSAPSGPRRVRVAVLLGGPSPEREVSVWSGEQVIAALDPARFDVLPVEITREGHWLARPELLRLPAASTDGARPRGTDAPATTRVCDARQIDEVVGGGVVDVAFIAMHGPYGEDGTVQGMLELLGIPYTGSGVLASALAMDKLRSRQVLQANGIVVPAYVAVEGDGWSREPANVTARVARDLGYPCVVKPNAVGSSIGVAIVRDEASLRPAVEQALGYGDVVLIEEYLRGTELTCAVVEDPGTGAAQTLPLIEIVPKREFFTYEAKYVPGASEEIVPARIPAAAAARAEQVALRVHRVLGCEGFSRVDMFLAGGTILVLEANTIPGMAQGSLIPLAARAAGIEFPDLLRRIIENALRRARVRNRRAGRA